MNDWSIKPLRMKFKLIAGITILLLAGTVPLNTLAQVDKPKCCDNNSCRTMAAELATKIAGITVYLGNCDDPNDDSPQGPFRELNNLKATRPELYDELIRAVSLASEYFFSDERKYSDSPCFSNALPRDPFKSITLCWINFIRFNVLKETPKFPSTEFCRGWSKRIELNQGATAFLSKKDMGYLGSLRGFLSYTFKKQDTTKAKQCGGRFRLSAGPAVFLRQNDLYLALSSRAAIRITDLKSNVFSLGNLNCFAGYNSNFQRFSYAELGLEAEIGPLGFNLAANLNTNNGKAGFLVGILFANKKL